MGSVLELPSLASRRRAAPRIIETGVMQATVTEPLDHVEVPPTNP